jgi:MFS family permease
MKLNVKKTIFVGIAFLIISMFWQVYDNIIAKMLINSFGLDQFWSGIVMALDNILALILLPLFGALSDKTKTKYGKRTPYIFIGVIVSALLFVGVSVVDSMQIKSVEEEKISIVEVEERDGKTVYVFEYDGTEYVNDTKEDAELARGEIIRDEITLKQPKYLISFMVILFFVLVAMASYRTPAVSLMPDVTPKPLRSKANAIINLMGALGGVISLGLMTFLAKDFKSYVGLFIVVASLMLLLLVLFLFLVSEPKLLKNLEAELEKYDREEIEDVEINDGDEKLSPAVRKSFLLIIASIVFWFMAYNAVTSKFSVYAQNVLEMGFTVPLLVANAAAIICFVPIGIIASKIGRRKTILAGIIILLIAFALGIIANPNTKFLIYFTMSLAGIGWATINVNSYPMIVEMSKGANIGKYTGYYYSASMAAQIATPILSGYLMTVTSLKMRVLFPYAVIFSILAFTTMFFVKHGDSKPIPKSKLEAFEDLD